jgi:hypothetical protein
MEDVDEAPRLDEPIVLSCGSFRPPTSRDLAQAATETDARLAAIKIVENCRIAMRNPDPQFERDHSGQIPCELPGKPWSDNELEEIGERMALVDPLAETRLTLHCVKCGNEWEETFDIVVFVWAEIEARARRLLTEVNTLASAYGWTEAEILSLTANRRARYVQMAQS